MSLLRMILLGTYLAGMVGLVWAVIARLGVDLPGPQPRGALVFAATCFLSTLATREITALIGGPKEPAKA